MSYSVKYIKLFEHSPFKTIRKQSSDNELVPLANSTNKMKPIVIKNDFIDIIKKRFYEQYKTAKAEYYTRFKKFGNAAIQSMNMYRHTLDFIQKGSKYYTIEHGGKVNTSDLYIDIDGINITSSYVEVIVPCNFGKSSSYVRKIVLLQPGETITPYMLYNGLLEYIFNNESNGYVDVLKKYGADLPVKVKFKIMNPDDVYTPEFIFYNYQDISYMQDFADAYINVFTNYIDAVQSDITRAFFLNCFGNSTNLSEMNSFVNFGKAVNNKLDIHVIYYNASNAEDLCNKCCNHINSIDMRRYAFNIFNPRRVLSDSIVFTRKTMLSIFTSNSYVSKPNFTSIDTTVLDNVLLHLYILFGDDVHPRSIDIDNKRRIHEKLSRDGFSNKLIRYLDKYLRSHDYKAITSTKLFLYKINSDRKWGTNAWIRDQRKLYSDCDIDDNSSESDIQDYIDKTAKTFICTPKNKFIDEITIYSNPIPKIPYSIL